MDDDDDDDGEAAYLETIAPCKSIADKAELLPRNSNAHDLDDDTALWHAPRGDRRGLPTRRRRRRPTAPPSSPPPPPPKSCTQTISNSNPQLIEARATIEMTALPFCITRELNSE